MRINTSIAGSIQKAPGSILDILDKELGNLVNRINFYINKLFISISDKSQIEKNFNAE